MTIGIDKRAWELTAAKDRSTDTAPVPCPLVRASQEGSHEAFRMLVRRHEQMIFRLSFRLLRNRSDAEEVTQDTFIRSHRSLARYRHTARFEGWLCRIALNVCRDRLRMRRRRWWQSVLPLDRDPPADPIHAPSRRAECCSDLNKLQDGLAQLAPRHREVLILSAVEDMSHRQCAETLGCSERSVEGRLYRARRALLEWWKQTR